MDNYIDPQTGQIYDAKEWIVTEFNGVVHKVKRLSDKQLSYIESLEYQLGYKPKSHRNMPMYKAVGYITKLQTRLQEKTQ